MIHLRENNETYLSHLLFAGKIGLTLIFRGFIFLLHALMPICNIPKKWNLRSIITQLEKWNTYTFRRIKK